MPASACLLPDTVRPLYYSLWFRPDLETFTFVGTAKIELEVLRPTNTIVLHAKDLVLLETPMLSDMEITGMLARKTTLSKEEQTLTLEFPEILHPGPIQLLNLSFRGELNNQMCGWYRPKYKLPSGEERWMATTQCQPTDARRIFPCWDEPAYKAVFDVTLEIPKNLIALSNTTAITSYSIGRGNSGHIHFAPTPKMSTYLFQMAVGEFEFTEGHTKDGVMVRIFATPGKKDQMDHALKRAIRTLEFLGDYFGYPYEWKKLDHIAIPDFASGAMENLGAITYRETAILIDPQNSSASNKDRVDEVLDHETAHMWFGDLVTMRWWDGASLNEGFATFMEYVVSKHLDPAKNAEQKFVADSFVRGLEADSRASSRPIHIPINHTNEIGEIFDDITYAKGAAVIRMLEDYLGPEVFQRGMQRYIRDHAYKSVDPDDLWKAHEDESGKRVRDFMQNWWYKTGYPVIKVSRSREKFTLCQEHLLYDKTAHKEDTTWSIPITICTAENPYTPVTILSQKETTFFFFWIEEDWVKFNAQAKGFYRVYYEPDELAKFKTPIAEKILPVEDRIELADDVFALTKAGYYSIDVLLDFLLAYRNEDNLYVWQVILARLHELWLFAAANNSEVPFRSFVRALVTPIADKLGWTERAEDSDLTKMLRGEILRVLGQAGSGYTVIEALIRFELLFREGTAVEPNLREAIYEIAAMWGIDNMSKLRTLYLAADLQEEQERLLGAMMETRNPHTLKEALQFLLSDKVRPMDVYVALRGASRNPAGRHITWKFVKENWDTFREMYEKGGLMERLIDAVCPRLGIPGDEDDVRSFFEAHPVPDAKRIIEQSIESIRINTSWLMRDKEKIVPWLIRFTVS